MGTLEGTEAVRAFDPMAAVIVKQYIYVFFKLYTFRSEKEGQS
jgi:hypothetical protein